MIQQQEDDVWKYFAEAQDDDQRVLQYGLDYAFHDSNPIFQSQEYPSHESPKQPNVDEFLILPSAPPKISNMGLFSNCTKIFNIVRDELPSQLCKPPLDEKKMAVKTKLIQKREKAKNRKMMNELGELESIPRSPKESVLSSSVNEEPVPPKIANKRMKKMVRNRVAAQNSRDRKKAYLDLLEHENEDLKLINMKLQERIDELEKWQRDHAQQKFQLPSERTQEEVSCLHCGKSQILQCGGERERQFGENEGTTSEDENLMLVPNRNSYGLSRAGIFSLFSLISIILLVGFYSVDSGIIKFDLTRAYHEARLMTQDDQLVKNITVDPKSANSTNLAAVMANCPAIDNSRWTKKIFEMQVEFEKKMKDCQREKAENAKKTRGKNSTDSNKKLRTAQVPATTTKVVPYYGSMLLSNAIMLESRLPLTNPQQGARPRYGPPQSVDRDSLFILGQEIQILIPARNVTLMSKEGNYLVPLPSNGTNALMEIVCQISDYRSVFVD